MNDKKKTPTDKMIRAYEATKALTESMRKNLPPNATQEQKDRYKAVFYRAEDKHNKERKQKGTYGNPDDPIYKSAEDKAFAETTKRIKEANENREKELGFWDD